jgi:hypothetical protein
MSFSTNIYLQFESPLAQNWEAVLHAVIQVGHNCHSITSQIVVRVPSVVPSQLRKGANEVPHSQNRLPNTS